MFVIKTGMVSEADVVHKMLHEFGSPYYDVVVLTGRWEDQMHSASELDDAEAIISVGTCGGLCPGPKPPMPRVGDAFCPSFLMTPEGTQYPDMHWNGRMIEKTYCGVAKWWSSGIYNTANTVIERKTIFDHCGATIIDDESFNVAKFAATRNIPFTILRVVSDTCRTFDDMPPAARNAIQTDGGLDIFAVIKSLLKQSGQIKDLEHCYMNYQTALAKLRIILDRIGPYCAFK